MIHSDRKLNPFAGFRPAIEALEERWLLDGMVSLGALGGPGDREIVLRQRMEVSIIVIGSAVTAALLYSPPGGSPGGSPCGQCHDGLPPVPLQVEQIALNEASALAPLVPDDVLHVVFDGSKTA